jgi:hypothetical protein
VCQTTCHNISQSRGLRPYTSKSLQNKILYSLPHLWNHSCILVHAIHNYIHEQFKHNTTWPLEFHVILSFQNLVVDVYFKHRPNLSPHHLISCFLRCAFEFPTMETLWERKNGGICTWRYYFSHIFQNVDMNIDFPLCIFFTSSFI